MKNSILLLLYMLIPLLCISQTTQIESDSLAHYSFQKLANTFESIRKTDPEKAKIYLNALYSKANTKEEKITAFIKMCHYEIFYGTHEKALSYINSAYSLAKNERNIQLACVYEEKGYYYYYKEKDFDNALYYYLKALAITEEKQDETLLIQIKHKIGALYYTLGALDKALKTYNLVYKKIETDTTHYNLKISVLKSLGNAYMRKYSLHEDQKQLQDSSSFFRQKGLQLAIKNKDRKAIAFFESQLGISSFIEENYATALRHFNNALKANKILKIQQGLEENYFYKGKTFLRLKQSDSAIYYIKKSEPFFTDASKKLNKSATYSLLSECYEQKGDLKNAIKYTNLAIEYTEQLTSANEQTKTSIDLNYTLPKLKKRISKLEADLESATKKKTGWYILSLLLIISLVLGYIFFKRREQKNKVAFQKLLEETKENNSNSIKKVIPELQTQQILDALEKFENDLLFLQQDCTLPFLAKKLNTNTAYLSNIINVYKNQSYTTYLKKLRIQYAIKRLKDDARFRAYTIESIAQECGFNTAKPFSRAFKKVTNIYPSTFIKNLNNLSSI